MYDTILFDLDGTLTDSGLGITKAVQYALGQLGYAVPPRESLFSFIGPPLHKSFQRHCGVDEAGAVEAVRQFRVYYNEMGGILENEVYPGIRELLRDLKAHYGATDSEYIPMTVYEAGHANFDNRLTQWLYPAFGKEADPGIHIGSEGKAIAGFATEQYKQMVIYIRQLVEEGLLDEDLFSAKSSLMQAFMNENHTSVSTRMLNIPDASYEGGVENYYISQPLTSQFTDTPVFAEPTIARRWGAMISTTCEDLDAALAYMDAFFAPESNPLNEEGTIYNLSLWLGEEGVDWEWVEEGKSYKEAEKPDGWSAQHGFSGTPYIGKFHVMRLDHEGKTDLLPQGVYNNCLPYAKTVIREEALALTEDENETYVEKWQDISKYAAQMFAAYVTGDEDIASTWDTYVENLNKMGLTEVLECYDAAYARYTAR